MATAKKAAAKKAPAKKSTSAKTVAAKKAPAKKAAPRRARNDAITLLTNDHKEVRKRFKAYEKLVKNEAGADERQSLAEEICVLLAVHAQIEEEIFYPAAREVLPEADLVNEAAVEHGSAKQLMAQLDTLDPEDEMYDAVVTVLGEYIEHHVEEEEGEMFKKVQRAKMDTAEVGERLAMRKQELMSDAATA